MDFFFFKIKVDLSFCMYLTGYELFHMTRTVYIIMFGKTCFQEHELSSKL